MNRGIILVLYFALFPLSTAFFYVIAYAICEANGSSVSRETIDAYVFFFMQILLGVWIFYRSFAVMKKDYLENEKTPVIFLCKMAICVGIALLLDFLCAYLIGSFFPNGVWTNEQSLNSLASVVPFPLFFLAVCIFGPISEEFVFRYAIQGGIRRKPWNVVIATLLFGFFHTGFHVEIIAYALPGLCYGIAYEKTKDISIPICMHAIGNIVAALL